MVGIFRYSKYRRRHQYQYFQISDIVTVYRLKTNLDPFRVLATTDKGRRLWGVVPLLGGGLGPYLTQYGLD